MEGNVETRGKGTLNAERMETHSMCNFVEALRLVQSGCQVRRVAWPASLLYISLNRKLGRVDLVREEDDGKGRYCYAAPYHGGAAIAGPPVEDLLAEDWTVVEDPRVPTEEGGKRAEDTLLTEIAGEDRRER
jgi:hypothetical protein